MEERQIMEMYIARNDEAISETKNLYGQLCSYIVSNILSNEEIASECEQDIYKHIWGNIVIDSPDSLKIYLIKTTRRLALARYLSDGQTSQGCCEIADILEELEDIQFDNYDNAGNDINEFLNNISSVNRKIFVRRYFYMSPISHIAKDYDMTESSVKTALLRTRGEIEVYLQREN